MPASRMGGDAPQGGISPDQCRAARGLLGMSQGELAALAGVSPAALSYFETGRRPIKPGTQSRIRSAIESRGVLFLARDRFGEGVRLHAAPSPAAEPLSGRCAPHR